MYSPVNMASWLDEEPGPEDDRAAAADDLVEKPMWLLESAKVVMNAPELDIPGA